MKNSKKIIIFDLDGTLTRSRTAMDNEMSELFTGLLKKYKAAIVSGGIRNQFEKQVVIPLGNDENLSNLYILPANGTSLWEYKNSWNKVYEDLLTENEKDAIRKAMENVLEKTGYQSLFRDKKGIMEDKGGQISLSVYNPDWLVSEKEVWDPLRIKREPLRVILQDLLPEFEVKIGGTTTIDVTRKGIDKGLAVRKILDFFHFQKEEALFVGDATEPGGNDYAATLVVDSISVIGPEDTKKVIKDLIT